MKTINFIKIIMLFYCTMILVQNSYAFNVSLPQSHSVTLLCEGYGNKNTAAFTNMTTGSFWHFSVTQGAGNIVLTNLYYVPLYPFAIEDTVGWIYQIIGSSGNVEIYFSFNASSRNPGAYRIINFNYSYYDEWEDKWKDFTKTFAITVNNLTITGNEPVCYSSNRTFTVSGHPGESTFNWSKSSNLTQVGGSTSSTYTVHALSSLSSSEGSVQVIVHNSTCNWTKSRTVWVGKPNSTDEYLIGGFMSYPSPFPCIYTYGINYGLQLSGVIDGTQGTNGYVWSGLYASLDRITWYAAKFVPNYPGSPYYGSGYVQVTGSNECGTSIPVSEGYGPCGGFMAIPNPADTYVDIDIDPDKFDPAKLSLDIEYVLYIYDNMGVVKSTAQFKDFPYRIITESWQEGVYFIQIQYNGDNYSLPIQINH